MRRKKLVPPQFRPNPSYLALHDFSYCVLSSYPHFWQPATLSSELVFDQGQFFASEEFKKMYSNNNEETLLLQKKIETHIFYPHYS